jgi:hypothetical protein
MKQRKKQGLHPSKHLSTKVFEIELDIETSSDDKDSSVAEAKED